MDSKKKSRTKTDAKKAAKAFYREGKTLKQSFTEAGFSETQSSKGKALLTERAHLMRAFKAENERQIKRLQLVGQSMDGEAQTDFVRGTLVDVAIGGKGSERVAAASWLGKDRRCNLFQPDTQIGLFQLQVPSGWESRYLTTEPDAVAQILPATFEPAALDSGRVVVPDVVATKDEEPIPAVVQPPSPEIEKFRDSDFEKF